MPTTARSLAQGIAASVVLAVIALSPPARADYPIASHRYLADPGSLVFNGRVYLYNSNDDDNALDEGYQMKSVVCISSSDLKNWTDHGVVFSVPAGAGWASNSWAPQPIEREGTIYLFFGDSDQGIGVAKSKDPTAGFVDARGDYLINASTPGALGTDSWLFDPGALIDTDGRAYLAFGGNGENNARMVELGRDLVSLSGPVTQLAPQAFFEASFLFKRNDIYYLAYSTNPANGMRIDYLTSKTPLAGYTYAGVIADQPPENGNNNHASEFLFNGNWYHAYHNRAVAQRAGLPATYKRSLGLESLAFNDDGSIQQVTYTSDGVPQLGSLNPYVRVEAETMNAQNGVETEACAEGGMNVTEISDGDWLQVRGVDFGAVGAKTFSARVASAAGGGIIELRLAQADGALAGSCAVPATGGPQIWQTISCDVSAAVGVQTLVLAFPSGSFNLNYWQISALESSPVGTGGASPGTGGGGGGGGGGRGEQAGCSCDLATGSKTPAGQLALAAATWLTLCSRRRVRAGSVTRVGGAD